MACKHGHKHKCVICGLEKELADQKTIIESQNAIIEQVENALINIRDSAINYSDDAEYVVIADGVLKAIRGLQ